jgi:hypothetical protein
VAAHLVATGDPVGYDQPIGPRLNAWRAVTDPSLAVPGGPPADAALDLSPNPAVAGTLVRFALPATGRVRLGVYDVAGRLERELANDILAAGPHALAWDGADARGRAVRSGVHLVRLETPAGVLVRKLVRTR